MKRIGIISSAYASNMWNSHGRSTYTLAHCLANLFDVSVYTFTDKDKSCTSLEGQVLAHSIGGLNTKFLAPESYASWNKQIRELVRKDKLDCIILNNWHGWEACKDLGVKVITVVPFLYNFTGWLKSLDSFLEVEIKKLELECIAHSDTVIAHSEQFGLKLANYFNRDFYVVPNICKASWPAVDSLTKKNQVCFVGKLNIEKCVERIVRILPDIPDLELVIASDKNNIVLNSLAKKLDVDHRISFVGWLNLADTVKLYRESKAAIVPSNFEPYGYSVLDPVLLGTNVIVSEWSCLSEYVNGKNVFSSLKQLVELINNPVDCISENRERAIQLYSPEAVATQLASLI